MKCLFVSSILNGNTGGGIVSKVIKDSLDEIFKDSFYVFEFSSDINSAEKLKNVFFGNVYGMNSSIRRQILDLIEKERINCIFINGSAYGLLAKEIKNKCPNVYIITFCHNVEYYFVKDAFKRYQRIGNLMTLYAVYLNEKNSVQYSNLLLTLNTRDSDLFLKLYGRKADDVLPLSIRDKFDIHKLHNTINTNKTGLFVGSNFYANYFGIKWFAEYVSPYIDAQILIVGKDFEKNQDDFSSYKNIKVVGTVDNVNAYYYDSDFVISPIFEGSGMKTKTAEALMFGKTIFGTAEAFEGYEIEDYSNVGALCLTAADFINSINNLRLSNSKFNIDSREYFINNYSYDVFHEKITKIIQKLIC